MRRAKVGQLCPAHVWTSQNRVNADPYPDIGLGDHAGISLACVNDNRWHGGDRRPERRADIADVGIFLDGTGAVTAADRVMQVNGGAGRGTRTETSLASSTGAKPKEPPEKPILRSFAASSVRRSAVGALSTTTISVRPARLAVATMLNPESQIKPVFNPVAPW
jgi:hypothetical protein